MAYSKRIPPIKIKLNVDEYNKLLEILENMILLLKIFFILQTSIFISLPPLKATC